MEGKTSMKMSQVCRAFVAFMIGSGFATGQRLCTYCLWY